MNQNEKFQKIESVAQVLTKVMIVCVILLKIAQAAYPVFLRPAFIALFLACIALLTLETWLFYRNRKKVGLVLIVLLSIAVIYDLFLIYSGYI